MAKKQVTGEDGKTYTVKEKKPFYTRISFWALVIIIFAVGYGIKSAGGSSSDNSAKVTNNGKAKAKTSSSSSESADPTKKVYKVGETADFKGYAIKVNKVDYNNGDDVSSPDAGKHFVIVNVTITNGTNETQDYNPYDFNLKADGNSTSFSEVLTSIKDDLHSGSLDKGATVTGSLVGQAPTNAKKLQLTYKTSIWNDETVNIDLN